MLEQILCTDDGKQFPLIGLLASSLHMKSDRTSVLSGPKGVEGDELQHYHAGFRGWGGGRASPRVMLCGT